MNSAYDHDHGSDHDENYKWINCCNKDCKKHLAKIIYPLGLIEIIYSSGKNKKFELTIHGSIRYRCPTCGTNNVINLIKNPSMKRLKNYKQAHEAHQKTNKISEEVS